MYRQAPAAIAILLAFVASLVGCGFSQASRTPHNPAAATPDGTLIADALSFGSIVLPAAAKVLAVNETKGIDQLYTLAIEVDPTSIEALLAGSRFTTPLSPGHKVFMEPAPGFNPNNSTNIASAQDRLPADGERAHTVTREVLIDRTNPAKSIIHLWLFTT